MLIKDHWPQPSVCSRPNSVMDLSQLTDEDPPCLMEEDPPSLTGSCCFSLRPPTTICVEMVIFVGLGTITPRHGWGADRALGDSVGLIPSPSSS